jgi:hypothetical protein
MTSEARAVSLERAMVVAGIGWMLAADRDARLTQVLKEVDELSSRLSSLLKQPIDVFVETTADVNTWKPLIQTFAAPMTTDIRAAIYCLLAGGEIASLAFAYERKQAVSLHLTLDLPLELARGGRATQDFASTELWDAEFLRHLGLAKLAGRPLIDGYYAYAKEP